jgi:hypothetical protein
VSAYDSSRISLLSRNDYFLMPKARRVLKGQPERSLLEIRSFELQRGKLPDTHALIGREIVRVPWLYSEGRIPVVHIAGWADYPEHARGVGVGDDLLSYVVFPRLARQACAQPRSTR